MKRYITKKGRLIQGILLEMLVFSAVYDLFLLKPIDEKRSRIIPLFLYLWPIGW